MITTEITLRNKDHLYLSQELNPPHTILRAITPLVTITVAHTHERECSGFLIDNEIPHDLKSPSEQGDYQFRKLVNGKTQTQCGDEPVSAQSPILSWTEQLPLLDKRDKLRSHLMKLSNDELAKLIRTCANQVFSHSDMSEQLTNLICAKPKPHQINYLLKKTFTITNPNPTYL